MLGIFLDSEASGLNPHKHKILEIAFKVIDVTTGKHHRDFQAVLTLPHEEWKKSDPDSIKVNGFTWEEIARGKKPEAVGEEIKSLFHELQIRRGNAVFICQNPSFDRAYFAQLVDPDTQELLQWPYHWLDLASMYWAKSVAHGEKNPGRFPWKTGFSKDKIAATFELPGESRPHRAMNGVNHLLLCYKTVVGFPS
jgi:DNA polymerase-3 subunit epsilon/oligoribonuclease